MAKKKFFSDIGLKTLSVFLAISLWFFVTYRGQTETVVDAPIEFKNIPKGLEILKQNIKKVSLNIRGHERTLRSLGPSDIRVVVNLLNAKQGEADYYFSPDNIVRPRAIKILRMEPTYAKVTLDESVSKFVVVKPYVVGTPDLGYQVVSATAEPSTVKVEGPRTEVARINMLRTEPVDISGLDTNITQEVRINTNGKSIRISAAEVTVKINLKRTEK